MEAALLIPTTPSYAVIKSHIVIKVCTTVWKCSWVSKLGEMKLQEDMPSEIDINIRYQIKDRTMYYSGEEVEGGFLSVFLYFLM